MASPWQNRSSPYNKTPQYPSTEGFVPLGFSSPLPDRTQTFGQRTPDYFSGRKQNFQNRGRYQNNYNNQQNQRRWSNNKKNFQDRQQPANVPISAYFHPSILEDPWKNLMGKPRLSNSPGSTSEAKSGNKETPYEEGYKKRHSYPKMSFSHGKQSPERRNLPEACANEDPPSKNSWEDKQT